MICSLKNTSGCIALALALPITAAAADPKIAVATAPSSVVPEKTAAATDRNPNKLAENNSKADKETAEKRKQISAEATAAIAETRNALNALDLGKKDDALAALERAAGKLALILAREPKLALAPTNVSVATFDVVANADKVREARKAVETLIDDGQIQTARHLLNSLASETVISVSNVPLATYPAAIEAAAKLIDDGKPDAAKRALQVALDTQVVTTTIIPLPVVAALELLKEAEKLAEKADRKDEENKRLNELLTQARAKLDFAQALGYGTKRDFKESYVQLDEIKEKTSSGKFGTGIFNKIKTSLSGLFKSGQPDAGKQTQTSRLTPTQQPGNQSK